MDQSKIAVRYAKAFFSLAKEKKMLPKLKPDVDLIEQLIKESADFILMLESPVIRTAKKLELLEIIFEGKINGLTLKFLKLITENKREVHLPGICRNFLERYRRDQGVKAVSITSAIPLEKDLIAQIQSKLENGLKNRVELSEHVKENLIGGFVLRIEDRQVDASLSAQLRKVREIFYN